MFLTFEAGTAHGEKILAALQCHLLGKGNIVDIAIPHRFDIAVLIHGVRSGEIRSLLVTDRIGKDRTLDRRMEADPLLDREHLSL